MKIEELYEPTEPTHPDVRIHIPRHLFTRGCRNGRKNNGLKISSVVITKATTETPAPSKSRQRRSKMRLEQVNKHEEKSYLLDAETNEAILKNAVSKDELCRYLSPLKFIEIDTWRKEVPYGLTQESEAERRKWRTPIELLCGGVDAQMDVLPGHGNSDDNDRTSPKIPRRQGIMQAGRNFSAKRKSAVNKTNIENGQPRPKSEGLADPQATSRIDGGDVKQFPSNNPREAITRRPSTSPDRHVVITRINSEKILTPRQLSATTQPPRNEDIAVKTDNRRGHSSYEGIPLQGAFYNRPPLSSSTSLRRSNNSATYPSMRFQNRPHNSQENDVIRANHNFQLTDNYLTSFQRMPENMSLVRSHSSLDQNTWQRTTVSDVRPRTRGGERDAVEYSAVSSRNDSSGLRRPSAQPTPPEVKSDKIRNTYSDPNIAYVPHSPRRTSTTFKREPLNAKVRNYYAAIQDQASMATPRDVSAETTDAMAAYNANYRNGMIREAKTLPRRTFNSNQKPVPYSNVSPRIVYPNQIITNGIPTARSATTTTHHSPWVTQALPDLNNNDVMARAERDGYYVRKPSKTVTFRLGERINDTAISNLQPTNKNEASSQKNVSMLLVNVDESQHTPRNLLSRGGAVGITSKPSGFTNGNAIPVRP